MTDFQLSILEGIPSHIPAQKEYDSAINHAPKRKDILNSKEKELALKNALRYFPKNQHAELAEDFAKELKKFGRIYMLRYRPNYEMKARSIYEYPGKSDQAKSIMLMIKITWIMQ